jgi:L-ectoine synthase
MGVTLTDAILEPGLDQTWCYKNHLEAVYCLEGQATLEDLSTGATHLIKPGTLYAFNKHDRHRVKVTSRMRVSDPRHGVPELHLLTLAPKPTV